MTDIDTSAVETRLDSLTSIDTRRLQIGCWVALIAIAIIRAWFTRYESDPDSMAYLDIARAITEGHAAAAVHSYWSPGYPVLLSFFLRLFHPNAPGAIALPMFAIVHVESRFLGGWMILLFGGVICACSLPTDRSTLRAVSCVGFAALLTAGAVLVSQASQEALKSDHAAGRSPRNALIAVYLLNNGLRPGNQVAVMGDGSYAYWAHLARLHIVAEIPANIRWYQAHPALDFWESGPEQQQHSLRVLEQTGAKAVIADTQGVVTGSEPSFVPAPWRKIDGTDAYVYFFHANP